MLDVPFPIALGLWVAVTAIFYSAPGFPLSVAAGLILLALGIWWPDVGLLLIPAVAALEFLPKQVHGSAISLGEALIGACFAGWLLRCYWRRRLLVARGPFLPLALGLLVVGFVSLFAAAFPRYSLRDYREVIAEPVLYFVMLTSLLSPAQVKRLVGAAIAGGVGVALAALAGYATHRGVIAAEGVSRLAGIYPSPDNLALFLDRPLAMAGGLALWSSGRTRRLCALACLPMLLAIILTFARGAWVAVLATAVLAGLLVNRRLLWLAVGATVLAVAGALLSQARRLVSLFSTSAGSTTGRRLLLWRASWSMARDHPLQGIGLDNFLYQYPRYRLPAAASEPFLSHPHNIMLDFWLSLGLLGLAWLAWTVVTIVQVARRTLAAADAPLRALALGLTASLVIGVIHGLVDNSYFLPDLAVLFWLAVGGLQLLEQAPLVTASSSRKDGP